ncbi:amidohydrolase family protein [Henriciella barbarensis]|uniref:amidohydrolase family protein n=1 Tax=Henriciella barbarensis TaxID=86342 RepID=UPI0015FB279C|nr:amidohydrolase family protein [Henriciella barbarensis]
MAEQEPGDTGALLLTNARLIDLSGEAPRIEEPAFLLVRGGEIAAIGDATSNFTADEIIDLEGRTVTPGLVDMHVHVWDEAELNAYLSYGVTTVRNLSGMPFHLKLQDEIARGERLGPRLLTSGPILNSAGANQQPNHQLVETADEARAAVAWQADAGFTRLKVYSNLSRDAYEAALDEARLLGMAVTGHSPEGVRGPGVPESEPFDIAFGEIIDDGFETLEHVETMVWHGLRGRKDEAAARTLARRLAEAGVAVTPTRVAHHNLLRMAETGGAAADRDGMNLLNPFVQALEADVKTYWAAADARPIAEEDALQARMTKILAEEGVMLVAGSDAGIFINAPGQSLGDELRLLVVAGLTPYQALQAATWNAAVVLGESDDNGCIEAGCAADLAVYSCDPLADIDCAASVSGVVRAGEWLGPERLQGLRRAAAQHDVERTQANLFEGLEAQGTPIPNF